MDNNQNNVNMQQKATNTPAVVSMVLGILSIVLCWLPIVGLVLGIIAIVLCVKGFKNVSVTNSGKGFAIAGVSCGSVGLVCSIIYTIFWIFTFWVFTEVKDEFDDIEDEIYNYNSRYNYNYNYDYDYDYDDDDVDSILDSYDF